MVEVVAAVKEELITFSISAVSCVNPMLIVVSMPFDILHLRADF